MRLSLIVLTSCALELSAQTGVLVNGVTSTQAIISYDAPSSASCSIQVSQSNTYSPLVYDVDPSIFLGADQDSRSTSTVAGLHRVFVVGARKAQRSDNPANTNFGTPYSRALQADTPHFFKITCPGGTPATGTFSTKTIALGNTWTDPVPTDPNASSYGYFIDAGAYGYPEFVTSSPTEKVVDPLSGIAYFRISGADNPQTPGNDPTGTWGFGGIYPTTVSGWTNPTNITGNGSFATVTSSTNQVYLFVNPGQNFHENNGLGMQNFRPHFTGLCTGACAGDDAKIQVACTVDNHTPWAGVWKDVTLTTTSSTVDVGQLFTNVANGGCQPNGGPYIGQSSILPKPSVATTQGTTVNVDSAGNMSMPFTAPGGGNAYFDPSWTNGSVITINAVGATATAGFSFNVSSITVSGVSGTILIGQVVIGIGIQGGTTVTSVAGTTIGLSKNTDAPVGSTTLTFVQPFTCKITSIINPLSGTIDLTSCPSLPVPITGAAWSGNNFGLLVRKKTNSSDVISLKNAQFDIQDYEPAGWKSGGSATFCAPTTVHNSVTGTDGYVCIFPNGPVYWISTTGGFSNYLGNTNFGNNGGTDGWNAGQCLADSRSWISTGTTPQVQMWCSIIENGTGRQLLGRGDLTTTGQPGSLTFTINNITPYSIGAGLYNLVNDFTSGQPATAQYNSTRYPGCTVTGAQNNGLVTMRCPASAPGQSGQNATAWLLVFDPNMVSTNLGCVGHYSGGAHGCIVAATPTWIGQASRWSGLHSVQYTGPNSGLMWVGGNYIGFNEDESGHPSVGSNRFHSQVTSVNGTPGAFLSASPACAAGTNCTTGTACPANSKGCDVIVIDGEPYDNVPVSPFGGNYPYSFSGSSAAWDYLQDIAVNDICDFNAGTAGPAGWGEPCRILSRSGGHTAITLTIERGYTSGITSSFNPVTAQSTNTMYMYPSSQRYDFFSNSSGWMWDYVNDPHNTDSTGAYEKILPDYTHGVSVHGTGTNDIVSDIINPAEYNSGGVPNAYGLSINGADLATPPSVFTNGSPSVNGTTGATASAGASEEHIGKFQYTSKWFTDDRPIFGVGTTNSGAGGFINNATLVAGTSSVWKFTSTNNVPSFNAGGCSHGAPGTSDGDNLYDLGGACVGTGNAINRKLHPILAYCGTMPVNDISGPQATIDDTKRYTMCIARRGGECRTGSTIGDIYMNCPYTLPRQGDGSFGCGATNESSDATFYVTPCAFNNGAMGMRAVQFNYNTAHNDPNGAFIRQLDNFQERYTIVNANEAVDGTPDGAVMLRSAMVGGFLPSLPTTVDTVARWNYVPLTFTLSPPAGLNVNNAIVRFGYAEYGAPTNLNCTSRQEACIANAPTLGTVPFFFGTDGTAGTEATLAGQPCATGCTITLPVIAEHVVWVQFVYRNASGGVLATSKPFPVTVP